MQRLKHSVLLLLSPRLLSADWCAQSPSRESKSAHVYDTSGSFAAVTDGKSQSIEKLIYFK